MRMDNHAERLTQDSVLRYWKEPALRVEVFEEVTSTNTLLKQRGDIEELEGLVYVANRQTQGRGRRGRSFYSPAGTGIYTSILLRPQLPLEKSLWMTTCAAAAVGRVLEGYLGEPLEIKWVNDIYYRGRKVCGILTEGILDAEGGLRYAVLGIGINVYAFQEQAPEEICQVAGALFGEGFASNGFGNALKQVQTEDLRSRIVADIWSMFWKEYQNIARCAFFADYQGRLMWVGKSIVVLDGAGRGVSAKLLRLNEDFSLQIQYEDGREEALFAGEISIRPGEEEAQI